MSPTRATGRPPPGLDKENRDILLSVAMKGHIEKLSTQNYYFSGVFMGKEKSYP